MIPYLLYWEYVNIILRSIEGPRCPSVQDSGALVQVNFCHLEGSASEPPHVIMMAAFLLCRADSLGEPQASVYLIRHPASENPHSGQSSKTYINSRASQQAVSGKNIRPSNNKTYRELHAKKWQTDVKKH